MCMCTDLCWHSQPQTLCIVTPYNTLSLETPSNGPKRMQTQAPQIHTQTRTHNARLFAHKHTRTHNLSLTRTKTHANARVHTQTHTYSTRVHHTKQELLLTSYGLNVNYDNVGKTVIILFYFLPRRISKYIPVFKQHVHLCIYQRVYFGLIISHFLSAKSLLTRPD